MEMETFHLLDTARDLPRDIGSPRPTAPVTALSPCPRTISARSPRAAWRAGQARCAKPAGRSVRASAASIVVAHRPTGEVASGAAVGQIERLGGRAVLRALTATPLAPPPAAPPLVRLSYAQLKQGADLTAQARHLARSPLGRPSERSPQPVAPLTAWQVAEAYGYDGLGILAVTGVPGLREAREALLPLGAKFAVRRRGGEGRRRGVEAHRGRRGGGASAFRLHAAPHRAEAARLPAATHATPRLGSQALPPPALAQYEKAEAFYSVGWSHGKEKLEGKPDIAKASCSPPGPRPRPAPRGAGCPPLTTSLQRARPGLLLR